MREGGRGGYVNTEAVRRLCDNLTFGHKTSREKTFYSFYMSANYRGRELPEWVTHVLDMT